MVDYFNLHLNKDIRPVKERINAFSTLNVFGEREGFILLLLSIFLMVRVHLYLTPIICKDEAKASSGIISLN